MPRRTALSIAVALAAILLAPGLAVGHGGGNDPHEPSATVPPRGPGEDYKSDPAPGEHLDAPEGEGGPGTKGMSIADAQRTIDPGNDPSILLCKRPDGNFQVVKVRWASPEAAARFQRSDNKTQGFGLINDGGMCE